VLDSPLVSRLHARLDGNLLTDAGSANGTFVEGQPVCETYLSKGQRVTIGPYHLEFDGRDFRFMGRGLRVTCRKLTFRIPRGQVALLENIDLEVPPGTFLALVGTSGAGKSTLMKLMAGLITPSQGEILFQGRPRSSPEFVHSTGWVPQDEIVHARLQVATALRFSARLRLPAGTTPAEIDRRVQIAAEQVTLSHRLHTPILRLSGGERKRVALAAEELGDPDVFFLDEPTSGLDPGLEKEIMLSLRDLARRGRTVILITHATANILLCDRVLFLAPGGHPVYHGEPAGALEHFQVEDFAEIYRLLTRPEWLQQTGLKLAEKTRAQLASTVAAALPAAAGDGPAAGASMAAPPGQADPPASGTGPARAVPAGAEPAGAEPAEVAAHSVRRPHALSQLKLLLERDVMVTIADRSYMALLVLQAPIIGLVLGKLFPPATFALTQSLDAQGRFPILEGPTLLFMLVVSALFFGSINACRELVKERSIYQRERLLGVRPSMYLASKLLLLAGKGLFSVSVLLATVLFLIPIQWDPQERIVALVLLWATYMGGAGLGLCLSALVGTAEQATTLVTVVLILQLVFSGAFVKPEAMSFPLSDISVLAITRWTFSGLCYLTEINQRLAELHMPFITADYFIPLRQIEAILWPLLGLHLILPLLILLLRKENA
jgi:ABC-type multidrug transport system ATPase subunit